jgi:hypothetical protein
MLPFTKSKAIPVIFMVSGHAVVGDLLDFPEMNLRLFAALVFCGLESSAIAGLQRSVTGLGGQGLRGEDSGIES